MVIALIICLGLAAASSLVVLGITIAEAVQLHKTKKKEGIK
jgi:hypothetical protein